MGAEAALARHRTGAGMPRKLLHMTKDLKSVGERQKMTLEFELVRGDGIRKLGALLLQG